MSSDDEDESFVIYGTPLQEEEESRAGQRRKDVKDPALTKQLPLHQQVRCQQLSAFAADMTANDTHGLGSMQEVTDAEGRRRFHGAFTGGYSAGYYNTVGSLEGWNPSAYNSSREDRTKQRWALLQGLTVAYQ